MGSLVNTFDEASASLGEFFAPAITDHVTVLMGEYRAKRDQIIRVSQIMVEEGLGVLPFFIDGNRDENTRISVVSDLFQLKGALSALDAHFWSRALAMTDVLDSMPQARRTEWGNQILKCETPPFEEETVRSTLASMLASRPRYFAERVDGVFRELSPNHLTNRPEGFAKRMIVERILDESGYVRSDRVGYINDLRCVVARFHGRDEPVWRTTSRAIQISVQRADWVVLDGGAMRIRAYQRGTVHIDVHPDICWRLNAILASLYPAAIPGQFRTKPKTQPKTFATLSTALPFAVLNLLASAIKDRCASSRLVLPYSEMMACNARKEVRAVLEMLGGVPSGVEEFDFDYDPQVVLEDVVTRGVIPEQRSHQYYPTGDCLGQEAADRAGIEEHHDCLEPSAGTGGLARFMPRDRTLCIEISPLHCKVLGARKFQFEQADFLLWADKTSRRFDRIIMNPPFSDGRALLHALAAAGLLREGGRLVAILPASMKGEDVLPGFIHSWHGPYENQFEGTGVRVVMLVADKRGAPNAS